MMKPNCKNFELFYETNILYDHTILLSILILQIIFETK